MSTKYTTRSAFATAKVIATYHDGGRGLHVATTMQEIRALVSERVRQALDRQGKNATPPPDGWVELLTVRIGRHAKRERLFCKRFRL